MKTLYAFILLLFLPLLAFSQPHLYVDSTRFIAGTNPATGITCSIPTMDKGFLFAGYAIANAGGIIPNSAYAGENVMVGKMDSCQHISWIKVYGGNGDDGAVAVCQTPDGGYAILCNTGSNDGNVTGYKGNGDLWLIRTDDTGKLLWEKSYGSSQSDDAFSIANTSDHGFILFGETNGSDDDVPFHYGGSMSLDWLVIKTDSVGQMQWTRDLGGTGDEGGGAILAIDSSYFLIGGSNSMDHDCTDTSWHPGVNTNGDWYILKLDKTGSVLWSRSYGGSRPDGGGACAIFDSSDNTIVINGQITSNDYMVTGWQGQQDIWVVKVDRNGVLIWQKTLGSPNEEVATGLCAAHGSGYVIYGSTDNGPIGGGTDAWIFLLDNNGNEISNKIFGGRGAELPYSVIPYLNGYVAFGISDSKVFTEGTTEGRNDIDEEDGYCSYIDTAQISAVANINTQTHCLIVFPNPAADKIRICIPDTGALTIINSIGQVITAKKIENSQKIEINTKGWNSGIYLIVWQDNNGNILTEKLIKQ